MSYSDLLKSPEWQKKRLEILSRDNFMCQLCGSKTETLHVHHRAYIKGRKPWEYADVFLITLCEYCHAMQTYADKKHDKGSFELGPVVKQKTANGFVSIGHIWVNDESGEYRKLIIQDDNKVVIALMDTDEVLNLITMFIPIEDGQD